MRQTLFIITMLTTLIFAQDWAPKQVSLVNPLTFKDTPEERAQVLEVCKYLAKQSCDLAGMNTPDMLRIMETEELTSFKALVDAQHPELVEEALITCQKAGMVSYSMINIMYNNFVNAQNSELKW